MSREQTSGRGGVGDLIHGIEFSRGLILAGRFLVRLSVIEALVVGKPVKLLGRWKQIVRLLPGLRIAESAHS
jgi:hypothetical protein